MFVKNMNKKKITLCAGISASVVFSGSMVLAGFGGGGVKEDDDVVVLNESVYMENIVRYSTFD